jgi:hypothetical protein
MLSGAFPAIDVVRLFAIVFIAIISRCFDASTGDNTECLTDRIPREQSHVIAIREEAFE